MNEKPRDLYWLFLPMCFSFIGAAILDYKLRGDKARYSHIRKVNLIIPFVGIGMYEVFAQSIQLIVKFLNEWISTLD